MPTHPFAPSDASHGTSPADAPVIDVETPADAASIVALHEIAFGPGRLARAAERVREAGSPDRRGERGHDASVSFTAKRDGALVGSVRMTPVLIGGVAGHLLGPLAVRSAETHRGLGARLIATALNAVAVRGSRYTLLVGDAPYYGRHGFACVRGPVMPGPVDAKRLLVRWHAEPEPLVGPVRHAWAARGRVLLP